MEIESQRKRVLGCKIKDKKPALKLPFTLSNPLNYVNSYTVNVYYKPGNPGVGSYDPEVPSNSIGLAKFDTKTKRNLPFDKPQEYDAPIQYDTRGTFENIPFKVNG